MSVQTIDRGQVSPGQSVRELPPTAMHVDPRFLPLADRFFALYKEPQHGGGALTAYLHGEKVLDIWAGWAERNRRWSRDTMTLSFSTGKGVASTVVHRLAERGLIDYFAPVAQYWPEFAAGGKGSITVADVMTHSAGLHRVRGLVPGTRGILDYDRTVAALAAARPDKRRHRGSGYHAVTYGWLVAEIAARVTGKPFVDVVEAEIAEPLGIGDFWYRVPPGERHRIAPLFPRINPMGLNWGMSASVLSRIGPTSGLAEAAMPDGFDELVRDPAVHDSVMPGWNGVFTARALARMYGAIAAGGVLDGRRFLDPGTIAEMNKVRRRGRDYVLGVPMAWRLGYHQPVFASTERPRGALGHYGVGGSGAFADLDSGLSIAFTTNRLGAGAIPLGDLRLARLGVLARELARKA
ncbi:beta-lactamase family protein [Rhodococcus sp. HNM0563]|uniref:serine hydrolase domain-containing protein n=2 Tax=unclassified Rhodococcus (in: high G+C Gram-positive bacteria) TaxID=192944 RepID=UPI00146A6D57|nr:MULTISPECIES: serine hydrolase domain-containing protein [unclassified Rhodococcus (in: high G+C Gram-positive bacteria)]MCK0092030.1 beta-lactamase family protein [Rhodococcus sp. F64268]NLU65540.1 beta-lactamase family protein [Rhodococcus sp. HNM0563]